MSGMMFNVVRIGVAVVLAMFLTSSALSAQGEVPRSALPRFDCPMPPEATVLKMRWRGFWKWARVHAVRMSPVQADQVARWYTILRDDKTLSNAEAAAYRRLNDYVDEWTLTRCAVLGQYSGNGQYWRHMYFRCSAERADAAAAALDRWGTGWTGKGAGVLQALRNSLPTLPPGSPHKQSDYNDALNEESSQLNQVKTLMQQVPTAVVGTYVEFMLSVCALSPSSRREAP